PVVCHPTIGRNGLKMSHDVAPCSSVPPRNRRPSAIASPGTSVAPLQFLLLVFAGWVNRHQADVVAYLQEENRVLREHLDGRRLRFTDAQRRRLATKGRAVGRRALEQLAGLVTSDTIQAARGACLGRIRRRRRGSAR